MKPISNAQEKKYIAKLLKSDEQVYGKSHDFYQVALQEIEDHLNFFIAEYGVDGLLKYVELLKRDSAADRRRLLHFQIKARINDDAQSQNRSKEYARNAPIDRYHTLNSLIGFSVAGATIATIKLLNQTLKSDFKRDVSRQFNNNRLAKKAGADIVKAAKITKREVLRNSEQIISKTVDGSQWSDDLWLYNDNLVNNVQSLVAKSLRTGLKQADVNQLFPSIRTAKPQTITGLFNTNDAYIRRMIVTERARVLDRATTQVFKSQGIAYFDWITQPGACDKCEGIADDGPYAVNDASSPSIPDDSHPNCRCTKIAHVSLVPLLGVAGAIAAADHSNKNQTSNDEQ
ncbi:hypothetical protein OQI89_11325 [Lentilactobacillus diolivorans]|uniref:hypothetical protein n=1 Tax=Lentilactobacillus diolivorans TaxID=179838 RepID=UPI00246943CF|nr:hypothetical protein [Lentilactobacillus diolivorans]MDH5106443.1 hypothetical protein [Lentilactobacillus diolivorans]